MSAGKRLKQYWKPLHQFHRGRQRVLLTSLGVAGCVIGLRLAGLLQTWEFSVFDQLLQLRPVEPQSDRVVVVSIDEADLQAIGQYPIPDQHLAQLIQRIQAAKPRAIGVDIYRDLPVEPGHADLLEVFRTTPNLIGIEHIADEDSPEVPAPPLLAQRSQIGFNNVVHDQDDRVRRGLLYSKPRDRQKAIPSFALALSFVYLQAAGIEPKAAPGSGELQLGKAVFRRFRSQDGGYAHADEGGYQILLNPWALAKPFRQVPMMAVMAGKVPAAVFRDRIVLIGYTAVSANDFVFTSYSGQMLGAPKPIAGVELHANLISQILGAAQDGRSLISTWIEPVEWLWIGLWSGVGAVISWKLRSLRSGLGAIAIAGLGLTGIGYGALLVGWWIPVVPPMLATVGSAVSMTAYVARRQEELRRSKEFLNSIINTIPDPIFVKDREHRWIVLNQAFAKLLNRPLETLLESSDQEVFVEAEASAFRQQDELVFKTGKQHQSEGELTLADGNLHYVETKRSLHKDAAGNLFLVGVMRDITERKRMEEELKQTAAELIQSNAELQRSATKLSHVANHDSLTGLPNRKLFYERLQQAIEWAAMNQQLVGLLFLDLDGFKQVNDTKGHDVGDLLLKAVAYRLSHCLRGTDTVSRLGGDEFTVILPAIPSQQDAARVADKLLHTLEQEFLIQEEAIAVTTSIGISLYPNNATDLETLIKEADNAMYSAKKAGKGCYAFSALSV